MLFQLEIRREYIDELVALPKNTKPVSVGPSISLTTEGPDTDSVCKSNGAKKIQVDPGLLLNNDSMIGVPSSIGGIR